MQIVNYYLLAEKSKTEPAEIDTATPPPEHPHLPLGHEDSLYVSIVPVINSEAG
uniref:Uncharacterized protein n=1 Tax=Heterorhabditis bacteriophora TaxID=37862 RepID=A0A1I7XC27_HETBA